MKSKRMGALLAVYCLSFMTLAGCSAENSRNYKQAAQDLKIGNYEIALEEYETSVAAGVVSNCISKWLDGSNKDSKH